MTVAETRLWARLRAHRFFGLSFRRQAPIGAYIVDFVCHEVRLVIELDGGQHGYESHRQRDAVRDGWLSSEGYPVLRVWNSDVLGNVDGVLTVIRAACGLPPSLPSPTRGEGETAPRVGRGSEPLPAEETA